MAQQSAVPQPLQCTPSLESILQSYAKSKDAKDTELLQKIILAKAAEDQRLARLSALVQTQYSYMLYVLQLKQLQEQQQQLKDKNACAADSSQPYTSRSLSPSSTPPLLSPNLSSASDASLPSPTSYSSGNAYALGQAPPPFAMPPPALGRAGFPASFLPEEQPSLPISESKRKSLESLRSLLAVRQASKNNHTGPSAAGRTTPSLQLHTAEHQHQHKSKPSRKRARSVSSQTSAASTSSSAEPEIKTPGDEYSIPAAKRVKKEGMGGLALLLNAAES